MSRAQGSSAGGCVANPTLERYRSNAALAGCALQQVCGRDFKPMETRFTLMVGTVLGATIYKE